MVRPEHINPWDQVEKAPNDKKNHVEPTTTAVWYTYTYLHERSLYSENT